MSLSCIHYRPDASIWSPALADVNGKILSEVHFSLIYMYMWYLPFPTSKIRSSLASFKSNPMVKIMFRLFPLPAHLRLMPWLAASWSSQAWHWACSSGSGPRERENGVFLTKYGPIPHITKALEISVFSCPMIYRFWLLFWKPLASPIAHPVSDAVNWPAFCCSCDTGGGSAFCEWVFSF